MTESKYDGLSSADILNSMPQGILIIDQEGRVLEGNHQMALLLGVATPNLSGMNLTDFWPQSAGEVLEVLRSGRQAAGLLIAELDGCFVQARPLPRDQNIWAITVFDNRLWQPYLGHGPTLDPLTPYYKQIFERSADGISIADNQGRLILVNEASARQVGLTREDLQGRPVTVLVDQNLTNGHVTMDVIRTKKQVTRLIKHHKTDKHIFLTGTPILTPDGRVHLVVINERDFTTIFELQSSLKQQKEISERFKDELTMLQLAELAANEVVSLSPAMSLTRDTAVKLARHGVRQVLITGESGTGKGLLAKFIHAHSHQAKEPFIHINCAALPESLLEAELFGYEKGAFTGAAPEGRAGLFEVAGEGVVFLDEIGEMPLALQAKLLTFLDNRQFRRLAGHKTITASCSIIAATNQDLKKLAAAGSFRQDLYFRLSTFSLHIPPLRERPEDLIELARREVEKLNRRYDQKKELDPLALEVLKKHRFPGNVRELFNCLNQAVLLSDGGPLGPFLATTLPGGAQEGRRPGPASTGVVDAEPAEDRPAGRLGDRLAEMERANLVSALEKCATTREMAALLGISQAGVSRKLKKYGLKPHRAGTRH